ncbi:MAG: glutamate--tRNA ligase [Rhodomicrobium sp.]|nr:MAG: glutamate--tRNA ligase [Rhodomicrobium sp.]
MTVITRFAPSPTGKIHIGNLRPAIINWMYARSMGGQFMLRIDDTDQERSTEEFAQGIKDDLTWLGLGWDFEARQSDRFDKYDAVVSKLKASGRLYPCYETAGELERKRKRQMGRGLPPVYDRAALELTEKEIVALEAEGRKAHWRFKLEDRAVAWVDLVRGEQSIEASSLSDPILVREDGTYLYTLPSVIDDIEFKISHVIRGEDHVANTGAQIQIFEALGATPPSFAHHNLLVGKDGEGLSKRLGSLSISSFRDEGIEPMAVVSHAATIGSSNPIVPHKTIDSIADEFAFEKLSRAPARFDVDELKLLNAKLLHDMDYALVSERLKALGIEGGESFWDTVKANIETFSDVSDWWRIVQGPIAPVIEDADFCKAALAALPPAPLNENSWGEWTGAVKAATGAKGKALFQPLRLALTGEQHGPELKTLLPLIGHERVVQRLSGEAA